MSLVYDNNAIIKRIVIFISIVFGLPCVHGDTVVTNEVKSRFNHFIYLFTQYFLIYFHKIIVAFWCFSLQVNAIFLIQIFFDWQFCQSVNSFYKLASSPVSWIFHIFPFIVFLKKCATTKL